MIPEHEIPNREEIRKIVSEWYAENRFSLEAFLKKRLEKDHPKLGQERIPNDPKHTYLDKIVSDIDSYHSLNFPNA